MFETLSGKLTGSLRKVRGRGRLTEENVSKTLDNNFLTLLTESLKKAQSIACNEMNPSLYKLLDWPVDILSYLEYLAQFVVLIPRQSKEKGWGNPDTGYPQEVYDHLCHF